MAFGKDSGMYENKYIAGPVTSKEEQTGQVSSNSSNGGNSENGPNTKNGNSNGSGS